MKNPRSLVVLALAAVLAALPACRTRAAGGDTLASITEWINVEERAPTLPGLRGKPVVVEFWATWCGPCVESVPHLVELHERHADEGLVILGIHSQRGASDRAGVEAFVERHRVRYPIGLDVDGAAGSAYGVRGIPKAFVYDREGELVWAGHPLDPQFDRAVGEAL